jgi:hypothetical protein
MSRLAQLHLQDVRLLATRGNLVTQDGRAKTKTDRPDTNLLKRAFVGIQDGETTRTERIRQAPGERHHTMIHTLARVVGVAPKQRTFLCTRFSLATCAITKLRRGMGV